MKRYISVVVLAVCSLFTGLTFAHANVSKHDLTADGVPAPPWPGSTPHADGVPAPPWPPTPRMS